MAKHSKAQLTVLWACVGGLVTACGGGSDGEAPSPPVGAQDPTLTLTSPVDFISGHYFSCGHDDDNWRHRHECLRMTFTMDEGVVKRGIQAIGEEVRRAHAEALATAGV